MAERFMLPAAMAALCYVIKWLVVERWRTRSPAAFPSAVDKWRVMAERTKSYGLAIPYCVLKLWKADEWTWTLVSWARVNSAFWWLASLWRILRVPPLVFESFKSSSPVWSGWAFANMCSGCRMSIITTVPALAMTTCAFSSVDRDNECSLSWRSYVGVGVTFPIL